MSAPPKKPSVLNDVVGGYWTGRIIVAALKLGIVEALGKAGSASSQDIATELKLDNTSVYRVLRGLTVSGFVAEKELDSFSLTEEGGPLLKDHPLSLRSLVLLELDGVHPKLYNHIEKFVTDGASDAFPLEYGTKDSYEYMNKDKAFNDLFHEGMSSYSRNEAVHLIAEHDFTKYNTIIDLGGGKGELIKQVRLKNPGLKAKCQVVDLPDSFIGEVSTEEVEYIAGDMVKGPIPSADCYLVKHIFEGFNDEWSLSVLKNLHTSMSDDGVMIIIEYTILPPGVPSFGKLLDCHMIVFGGGKGRTLKDMTELVGKAGFEVSRCVPSELGIVLTECKKKK